MLRLQLSVSSYQLAYNRKNLTAALRAAGRIVAAKARSLILSAPKPSVAGGPPANRTGLLARSLLVRARGSTARIIDAAQSNDAFYARFLETGATSGGGRGFTRTRVAGRARRKVTGKYTTQRNMAPRPFLTAALEASQAEIVRRVGEGVGEAITGVQA
ncbi:hypothetical protein [Roseicella sp. DB1501]|uniref:hypothetical protein n=1 Tax=Roseicella sp. DB1501 TaxID=2730925 RepID=UPI0014915CF3|nr:hypothetical protein [Roseicella sp. DB1501]NOG69809.1 hypothetical protein [Roseicella sp. DB1501]